MQAPIPPLKDRPETRSWVRWVIPAAILTALAAIFMFSRLSGIMPPSEIVAQFELLKASGWALPATVLIFVAGAYIGFPQFALFTGAILGFGVIEGGVYAWGGTLASGSLTFWTGRAIGEKVVARYAGQHVQRVSVFMGRNALLASAAVRNVPTAPFIIVNMAFGASQARYLPFLFGLALGILPKIAAIGLATEGVIAAGNGTLAFAAGAALGAILLWWGGAKWVRHLLAQGAQKKSN